MNSKIIFISAIVIATLFSSCKKKDSTTDDNSSTTTGSSNTTSIWVKKTSPVSTKLNDVKFLNSSVGFAVGNSGTVIKTSDGGENWSNVSYSGFSSHFTNCSVIDAQTVWVVSFGGVYKTTNGGSSWTVVTNTLSAFSYYDVQFLNATTGYLLTDAGIAKTVDGGVNWSLTAGTSGNYTKLQFVSSLVGWAQGVNNVLKTIDGGVTWTSLSTGVSNQTTSFFLDNTSAWVASSLGGNETMRITLDGGNSWSLSYNTSSLPDGLLSLWFVDGSIGYRSRTLNKIEKTTNGGLVWSSVTTPLISGQDINDFYFPTSTLGFAVGNAGTILKFTE